MRHIWLPAVVLAAVVLGLAILRPADAQVSLTSLGASNTGKFNPVMPATAPTTTSLAQMMPKINPSTAMMLKQPNPRNFDFRKMLPNFSFLKMPFINRSATQAATKGPKLPTTSMFKLPGLTK